MEQNMLDSVIQVIAEALSLSPSEISGTGPFNIYGKLDSLSFEKVILALEERFNYPIPVVDLLKIETIKELADYLEEKTRSGKAKA